MDSTLHYLKRADVGDEDNRHRQFPAMVVNIEKDAKLIQTVDTVEKQSNFLLSKAHDGRGNMVQATSASKVTEFVLIDRNLAIT